MGAFAQSQAKHSAIVKLATSRDQLLVVTVVDNGTNSILPWSMVDVESITRWWLMLCLA